MSCWSRSRGEASRESAQERQDQILRQQRSSPFVSVSQLGQNLGVSATTIRRDLKSLSARGEVNVVHWGASARIGPVALGSRLVGPVPVLTHSLPHSRGFGEMRPRPRAAGQG